VPPSSPMTVTPKFIVDQDEENVIVIIRVPHVRVSDAEVSLDGQDFTFWYVGTVSLYAAAGCSM